LTYFIINGDWITKWRNFVTNKGAHPGKINNKEVAVKIANYRAREDKWHYKLHDNEIYLEESKEIFVLSKDFWNIFETRYSCDVVIQIRKYNEAE